MNLSTVPISSPTTLINPQHEHVKGVINTINVSPDTYNNALNNTKQNK